jgi:hypothetical protein
MARKRTQPTKDLQVPGPISAENNVLANPNTRGAVKAPRGGNAGKVVLRKVDRKAPALIRPTKAALIRAELEKGATVRDAAKAVGADPAMAWDVAKAWSLKTGNAVPGMQIGARSAKA